MSEIIRVLRVIEYIGTREAVEAQIHQSLPQGTKIVNPNLTINVATLGTFPEILNRQDTDKGNL